MLNRFSYSLDKEWPPLAWCAVISRKNKDVFVRHGTGVELLPNGFCEAVWDGRFEEGRLDQTDIVFGSGAVRVNNDIVFVSSGSTVDRLHSWSSAKSVVVSNSLACLLSQIDASVDRASNAYFPLFESIIRGIDNYQCELPTSQGNVRFTYFRNLSWNGDRLTETDKPECKRDFDTFDTYHKFLLDCFTRLGSNLADPSRTYKLKPLATVSTGYDSPTGAAVAREAGLLETISISRGRGNVEDDGSEIAAQLGLTPIVVERDASFQSHDNIPLFIASDAKGEDLYFAGSQEHLSGRFLISGYSGSRVWDTSDEDYQVLRRGDQSGLSHTEARLHFGYFHCPTPFLGGLQEADIRAIGRSHEMRRWNVDSDYNRPVCRRILEEAGVSRGAFGQEKKAASVLLFDRRTFLPPDLIENYLNWMEIHGLAHDEFRKPLRDKLNAFPRAVLRGLQSLAPTENIPILGKLSAEGRLQKYAFHEPLFDHVFPWAMEKTIERYHTSVTSRTID